MTGAETARGGAAGVALEIDEDGLLVFDLGIEFAFCFGVADPDHLARQSVGHDLDLQRDLEGAIPDEAIHQHAALHDRPRAHRAGQWVGRRRPSQ